ncbi:HAMP domain-containing protein, partial [bacterium]|nr:HAMP domain-containing protein [bacterium]
MELLRSRILWKIYAVFVAVIVIAAIIVSVIVSGLIEERTLAEVRHTLEVRTMFLGCLGQPALMSGGDTEVARTIQSLGQRSSTRFTLIGEDGIVIADSDKDHKLMDNHASRPEILDSKYHAFGVAIRYSETLKTQMMYLVRPIRENGTLLGYARASLPLTLIEQRISDSRKMILFGIGIITLVALIFGFILARHFIKPLLAMTRMAEAMADGDFKLSLNSSRRDEIGRLTQAFNLMAEKSRERIETINTDRSKLNAIFTGMREGVVAVDCAERVILMNQAAASLLQVGGAESLGKPIWEITRQQELCRVLADAFKSSSEIKKSMNISYGIHEQVVEMHAVPLKGGEDKTVGAMVVLLDVSELRRLETVRRDFVSNASHELKTPITAIRALVETMIDDFARMPEEVRLSFLKKIAKQALRLSALVVDLMALSRFEIQPESQTLSSRVDLKLVVSDSVNSLVSLAEAKGVGLQFKEPDAGVFELLSDAEVLDQASGNVLDNAIKYTATGGQVTVYLKQIAGELVVAIQDTGIGIALHDKERIFERFYRVDKARSRELGGTGLGLAIVRHIVLAHKGRIEVDSQPGRGTTFRLIFSLKE